VLFSFYYISPNNYKLYDYDPSNTNFVSKEYTIQPNKEKILKFSKYQNKKIRILKNDDECIPLVFENKFKSENTYVGKNKIIKLVNSDLIIKNTATDPIQIKIQIYS
jgi:hypothetical protein